MRLAILSVTEKGAFLANELAEQLTADVYAKTGSNPCGASEYNELSSTVDKLYHEYEGLIFVMATGIVVRVIAPLIRDKRFDPAVVVVDESGEYAISLLTGYIGQSTRLINLIADSIGATPVNTASSDILQRPAADILAVKLDLSVEPFDEVQNINDAIVKGKQVLFFIDRCLTNYEKYVNAVTEMGLVLHDLSALSFAEKYDSAVVITDKELFMVRPHLFLRPATLAIGLDCEAGVTSAEIFAAIGQACKKIGRSMKSIAVIAVKADNQDEIGLLAAVQQLVIPVEFFSVERLTACAKNYGLRSSLVLSDESESPDYSEPAALLGAQSELLLLPATNYSKVTIAIAEVKYNWWEKA